MTPITPLKCLLDVADFPPVTFALPCDGRQQKHLCDLRKALVVILAKYANADGSGICPSVETMAKAMGRDRATIFRLLKDLGPASLGFYTRGGLSRYHGTRLGTLHIAKMQAVAEPDLFSAQESHLQNIGVASSRQTVGVASSRQTQPPLEPKSKTKPSGFDPAGMELPEWLPRDVWVRFVEYRGETKKPLTELVANANIEKLSELRSQGQNPRAVINQTIASGWSGFFEVSGGKKKQPASSEIVSASERQRLQREIDRAAGWAI